MLRVHQVVLPLDAAPYLDEAMLVSLCATALSISPRHIARATLVKRSVDARNKEDIHFALTVDICLAPGSHEQEKDIARRFRPNQVGLRQQEPMPARGLLDMPLPPWPKEAQRPIVIGAGPAGLFCALALACRGARPLLIERGQPVEQRFLDVEALEAQAFLQPESNVLFGEGGAGAFSDGKLTCGLNHPHIQVVLQTLVACGAPSDILTAQRPHIGTDVLRQVLRQLRGHLENLGAEVRFGHRLEGIRLRDGRVCGVEVSCGGVAHRWDAAQVFLAIGHSARDTYRWLHRLGVPMEAKPFAVGVRIEHLQQSLNQAQYGLAWQHPALPPAEYKLHVSTPDKRGAYTFCMCPGGQVIAAMHQPETLNVNGMSLHRRDGENGNGALLVGVRPADFGSAHPLAGVDFQLKMERAAYALAGGYQAPCQRVEDFLQNRKSVSWGHVLPTYRPGVARENLAACLPAFITENLRYALPLLGRRMKGFDHPDALLTGPETRSSAPVRILRDAQRQSAIGGLYPLGEGAGYAGGIVSAAVDGMGAGMA